MTSLFLVLVLYPEVKKRAQAELDSVLGRDRLPTFGDRPHLPYIDAMCKELMRWQMVTPVGAIISIIKNMIRDAKSDLRRSSRIRRRRCLQGIFYSKRSALSYILLFGNLPFKIIAQKGSIMVANAWCVVLPSSSVDLRYLRAILHDPESYPDPEAFKPERFLNEDGTVRDDPTIFLAFGVGKRICPGRHFVDATLFIVASSVLSVFDITTAKDGNGHEIPVKAAMSVRSGIVV